MAVADPGWHFGCLVYFFFFIYSFTLSIYLFFVFSPRKQPWISVNPSNETFLFSFCSAIEGNGCPSGSAVCRRTHGSSSQPVKLGNFTNSPDFSEDRLKQITVTFSGQTCPSNHSIHFSTHIIFKCGKTLVSLNSQYSSLKSTFVESITDHMLFRLSIFY